MGRRISTLILLCMVLSGVVALQVNIPQDVYEYARGDNITLPCKFTLKPGTPSPPKLAIISWSCGDTLILTYYTSGSITDIKSVYEGRVGVDVDIGTGKANLKLSSITLKDNKVFECRVQIPGDDEGKPADTARLVVLVAPSTPICEVQGKAEYGQNINLTCKSEEGSPTPTYSWQSRDVRNLPRLPAPRTTDKGGILSLYNISKDTSGYYVCTSRNKIRSATCNLTLAVMPPSMNLGSTAVIGGVIAALVGGIALIVLIYCCCCKKKKKDESYIMGVHEEEHNDKEPHRNGEGRRAEDAHGYDDSSVRGPSERNDRYDEHNERNYDRRSDYDDRRRDYDDRRSDYDDRRSDYDDRRSDYDDRRSDYTERRDKYSDRNERYDDDRRYDDHRDRRRDDDDRYDEPYDDRDRPAVPANKPTRRDYDDD